MCFSCAKLKTVGKSNLLDDEVLNPKLNTLQTHSLTWMELFSFSTNLTSSNDSFNNSVITSRESIPDVLQNPEEVVAGDLKSHRHAALPTVTVLRECQGDHGPSSRAFGYPKGAPHL